MCYSNSMDYKESWIKRILLPVVFFLLIVNLLVLDYLIGMKLLDNSSKSPKQTEAVTSSEMPKITESPIIQTNPQTCAPSCLAEIDKAIAPLKITITSIPRKQTNQVSQTTYVVQPTTATQKTSSVQEFFIPLGSGSSSAADWSDVTGVKAEVDSGKYGNIQKVLFEASVHVSNANQIVEVRLYNETDKYIVGNSEFLYPSGTAQNFRIAEIQLGQGAKIYKVQMKTQLGYTASLDQARIHITTN